MPNPHKAQARDVAREKAQRPVLHGGSLRRVYSAAIRKEARRKVIRRLRRRKN